MLFFKDVFHHRMTSPEFKQFYDQECHICSNTIKMVSILENEPEAIPGILASLDLSLQSYEDIKNGDNCDPIVVERLCQYLGIGEPGQFKTCPRWPKLKKES